MATISENKKNGKTVSYRFIVCLGRDTQKKQIRRFKTWTPPEGLSPAKARKAAEKEADAWEQEVKADYQKEQEAIVNGQTYTLPPEKRRDDFALFVTDTWLPLQVRGGNNKPATVTFYKNNAKMIVDYFKGAVPQNNPPSVRNPKPHLLLCRKAGNDRQEPYAQSGCTKEAEKAC